MLYNSELVGVPKVLLGVGVRVESVAGGLKIVTLFVLVSGCNSSMQLFRVFSGSQRRQSPLLCVIGLQIFGLRCFAATVSGGGLFVLLGDQ